jgi:hypothetical protein
MPLLTPEELEFESRREAANAANRAQGERERAEATAREQARLKAVTDRANSADTTSAEQSNYLEYGGAGGLASAAQGQLNRAMEARGRQGYQYDDAHYGESMAQAQQARGQQQQGLGMLRDQMDLSQSSAASRAVLAGGQQAQGAQSSLATVARGGAMGRIAAQAQAARGNIAIGQQAAGQANVVRQQEAARATAQYGQAASAMRAGDQATMGQASQSAEDRNQSAFQNQQQNAAREKAAQQTRDAILKANATSQQGQAANESRWRQAEYDREQGNEEKAATDNAAAVAALGSATSSAASKLTDPDFIKVSDKRLKRGAVHMSEASEMARSTPGFAYKYKQGVPGENPEDQQYGVMAQDLEKTPMGKATVMDTPTGKKVDTKKLTMVHQAMFHDLQKQLDSLKGARR